MESTQSQPSSTIRQYQLPGGEVRYQLFHAWPSLVELISGVVAGIGGIIIGVWWLFAMSSFLASEIVLFGRGWVILPFAPIAGLLITASVIGPHVLQIDILPDLVIVRKRKGLFRRTVKIAQKDIASLFVDMDWNRRQTNPKAARIGMISTSGGKQHLASKLTSELAREAAALLAPHIGPAPFTDEITIPKISLSPGKSYGFPLEASSNPALAAPESTNPLNCECYEQASGSLVMILPRFKWTAGSASSPMTFIMAMTALGLLCMIVLAVFYGYATDPINRGEHSGYVILVIPIGALLLMVKLADAFTRIATIVVAADSLSISTNGFLGKRSRTIQRSKIRSVESDTEEGTSYNPEIEFNASLPPAQRLNMVAILDNGKKVPLLRGRQSQLWWAVNNIRAAWGLQW